VKKAEKKSDKKTKSAEKRRGFYAAALSEAEKLQFEEACYVQGIDEEIALLRVRLKALIEDNPERIDLQMKVANTITWMLRTRYEISKEEKKGLKDAITKVLTEVALPLGVGIGLGVEKGG